MSIGMSVPSLSVNSGLLAACLISFSYLPSSRSLSSILLWSCIVGSIFYCLSLSVCPSIFLSYFSSFVFGCQSSSKATLSIYSSSMFFFRLTIPDVQVPVVIYTQYICFSSDSLSPMCRYPWRPYHCSPRRNVYDRLCQDAGEGRRKNERLEMGESSIDIERAC